MSREIKFRAWLKEEKKMVEVKAIDWDEKGNIFSINYPGGKAYSGYNKDNIELIQYTGLKDNNGVKIFEGDIIKYYNKVAVVKYGYHNCGCCHSVYGFTFLDNNEVTDIPYFGDCEVIGNIYENIKLLGGKYDR